MFMSPLLSYLKNDTQTTKGREMQALHFSYRLMYVRDLWRSGHCWLGGKEDCFAVSQ